MSPRKLIRLLLFTRNLRTALHAWRSERADSLKLTLESLGKLEIPSDYSAELIVVDNASTDGTAQLIQASRLPNLPLRYISEPRRGKSNGLNTALAAARGEIILWTDDDVRAPKDWIAGMCQLIEKGEADVTAAYYCYHWLHGLSGFRVSKPNSNDFSWLGTVCLMVRSPRTGRVAPLRKPI
jgi:glycosyltransferase involved in cell wall biosynthesis